MKLPGADTVAKVGARIAARMDGFVREAFAVIGAGLIVYGVYLMHRPGAFLVAGAFCVLIAWGRSAPK